MSDFDRDLEATLRGRLAGATLDLVENVLDGMERRVDQRVMALLSAGKGLTDEQAKQAWYEKWSVHELRVKLRGMATSGKSAAKRITPNMEMSNAA